MKTRPLTQLYKILLDRFKKDFDKMKSENDYSTINGICIIIVRLLHSENGINDREYLLLERDFKSRRPSNTNPKGKRFAKFMKNENWRDSYGYWWTETKEGAEQRILFLEAVINYLTKTKTK